MIAPSTHCLQCGQRLPVKRVDRAEYNLTTVARIRHGATALELGWDDLFYNSVCRKHGLFANTPAPTTPKTYIVPEIAKIAPAAESVEPISQAARMNGRCTFDPNTGRVNRGGRVLKIGRRQASVFAHIIKGTIDTPANGRLIAERLSIDQRGGLGGHVMSLREKLVALQLKIASRSGRLKSGYWIVDLLSNTPIKIEMLR